MKFGHWSRGAIGDQAAPGGRGRGAHVATRRSPLLRHPESAGVSGGSLTRGGTQGRGEVCLRSVALSHSSDSTRRRASGNSEVSGLRKSRAKLGVHLGLRRDCGSTLAPVGSAQAVGSHEVQEYCFEDAVGNYPSPDIEADNVNYLAGFHEIGIRSEYTDGRDMPRLLIESVEFEGPFYENWPPRSHRDIFIESPSPSDSLEYAREVINVFATRAFRRPVTAGEQAVLFGVFENSFDESHEFQESIKTRYAWS